ncbi:hypothetical protein KIH79_10450 [Bifidobacterium sp. 82T10]|uniref:Uncharacterized protein n=1 Tax=Bifidobacterium miconis TaxID=2834435 RepID=A0ABS6WH03_9BIFI|nr:hypothetical protein [Bifidobacterium miconis]MBW3093331.1 hypothetical protein [Bifidobacterium miconis]
MDEASCDTTGELLAVLRGLLRNGLRFWLGDGGGLVGVDDAVAYATRGKVTRLKVFENTEMIPICQFFNDGGANMVSAYRRVA